MCSLRINPDHEEAMDYITNSPSPYKAYHSEEHGDCVLEHPKDLDTNFWLKDHEYRIKDGIAWTFFKSEDEIIELAYDVALMLDDCPHPEVEGKTICLFLGSRTEPPEYDFRGHCQRCGKWFGDVADIPEGAELIEL